MVCYMTLNFNFNSRVIDHICVFKMSGSRMEAKLEASKFITRTMATNRNQRKTPQNIKLGFKLFANG